MQEEIVGLHHSLSGKAAYQPYVSEGRTMSWFEAHWRKVGMDCRADRNWEGAPQSGHVAFGILCHVKEIGENHKTRQLLLIHEQTAIYHLNLKPVYEMCHVSAVLL